MYAVTFMLLSSFALYDIASTGYQQSRKKKFVFLSMLITVSWLIMHDGLRWGIGTDWVPYYTFFSNSLVQPNAGNFEVGFVWLNKIVRYFTSNYSIFLVIHAIVVYCLISRTVQNYSVHPLFSMFVFYCLMVPFLGMSRQYIALAICFVSIQYISSRNPIRFLLCIFLALLFHRSVLLFIPAYFFHRQIHLKAIITVFLIAVIIAFTNIINYMPSEWFFFFGDNIGGRMSFYLDYATVARTTLLNSILGILRRGLVLFFILSFEKKIKNKNKYFNLFLNLYFIGVIGYILFNNTAFQFIVGRGLIYFNIMEIFLFPYIISTFKPGWAQRIAFAFVLIYCALIIERGFSVYYRNLGVDIFRPYNSVLINPDYEPRQRR